MLSQQKIDDAVALVKIRREYIALLLTQLAAIREECEAEIARLKALQNTDG